MGAFTKSGNNFDIRGFHKLDETGINANIGTISFARVKTKISKLLIMVIEPGPLINLRFQVLHYPFWTILTFACKIVSATL